jgi:hypothetical protein
MLNWWQWSVMAILPPLLILLYFLKLRRIPLEVPSTYLWKKTIDDLHVNSIWQRLRNNLLMWLQLLTLLLIGLALIRPGVRSEQRIESRSILMIDNSASMQATDIGKTRLDAAKQRALELISTMNRDDVAMVIAFSDRADVRQGYTSDQRRLRLAVESIQPTNRTTDLTEALRTASGLANPGRTSQIEDVNDIQVAEAVPAHLYLITDGGFSPPPVDLGNLTAEYLPIGSSSPHNVAVVAFTCQRNPEKPGQVEAFARLRNFGTRAVQVEALLRLDGQLIDAATLSLEAAATQGLRFDLMDTQSGGLELELQIDDDFSLDNRAFAALPPPRQVEVVVVTAGNTALMAALTTSQAATWSTIRAVGPDELESEAYRKMALSGGVDLFIYDDCSPPSMPQANTMFIGSLPPIDQWRASEPTGPLFVIDYQRDHPLLQYVDLATLLIAEGVSLQPPEGAFDLVRTDAGVLMAVAPRGPYQDAVIGMSLTQNNTNWPNRRSFPIFFLNSLEFLGSISSLSGARTVRPGQPVAIDGASRFDRLLVVSPSGGQNSLAREGQPQLVFTQTDDLGFYEVREPQQDRLLQTFASNLFSEQESDLRPAEEISIGLQAVPANASEVKIVRTEYWRWILILAFVVLTVEWLLYARRISF